MKVLVAGIIARYPFGGVTWCSLMYLLGLRALGHEVLYIEDTGECIYDPEQNTRSEDPSYGTRYIHNALEPFGLGDRWCFVNYDGSYHGVSRERVQTFCADAELFINLSGGAWFWRDEYVNIPRKVFIDSDPVFTQLAIAKAEGWYVDFFRRFDRLFTFGANIGTPASAVPDGGFTWHKTWQPIVTDLWHTEAPPAHDAFTTVMTWKIESFADVDGNKDKEFIKVIDLPSRVGRDPRAGRDSRGGTAGDLPAIHFKLAVNGPRRCCGSTDGTPSTRWACRARSGTTGRSSRTRKGSSAWPRTRTWRIDRGGSATAPSAISPRAGRPSCRTPGGARTCRTERG
jgi:hypothetical protein